MAISVRDCVSRGDGSMGHGKYVARTDYGVVQLSPEPQTAAREGVGVRVVCAILVAHAALETGVILGLVLVWG